MSDESYIVGRAKRVPTRLHVSRVPVPFELESKIAQPENGQAPEHHVINSALTFVLQTLAVQEPACADGVVFFPLEFMDLVRVCANEDARRQFLSTLCQTEDPDARCRIKEVVDTILHEILRIPNINLLFDDSDDAALAIANYRECLLATKQ